MSSIRITTTRVGTAVAAAALAGGALAGCTIPGAGTGTPAATSTAAGSSTAGSASAGSTTAAPTTTAAPEGAVGAEEQAVAAALTGYQSAIASGDYTLACSQMTAENSARFVAAVQSGAGAIVPGCVQAMEAVLTQPEAAAAAVEAASSITVTDVTIQGMTATARWTSTRQGIPRTDSLSLQQVDLRWLVAGPA